MPTVGGYQQATLVTPVNGDVNDAAVVLANDNAVATKHNSHDADATIHVQSSVLASRPAFGTAGRIWVTSDGLRAYYDTGSAWTEVAYLPLVGGVATGGVPFPAVQVPIADANTLDDYEEGSFTPVLAFGGLSTGITYATQAGTYTKIGNIVHFALRITLTSKGSATGTATVTGLPFSVNASTAVAVFADLLAAAINSVITYIDSVAPTTVQVRQFASGASALIDNTGFTNTSVMFVSGTYRV